MKRLATTFVLAVGCAGLVYAQSDKVKTKVKADDGAKVVSYSGCVQSTPTRSYVLEHVAPVSRETTVGTDGTTTTTTTFALVPEASVQLEPQVGHRVEVTGVRVPAGHGDVDIKTRTKVNGHEEKSKTEIDKTAYPQFRVMSVKASGESCSVN
jgi:hypothetical protein